MKSVLPGEMYINQHWAMGDSLVTVPGYDVKILPPSGVIEDAVYWSINAEMLRQGVATLYTVPPDVKHVDQLTAAQNEAQAAERGIWGASAGSPLQILTVNYDAPGNDNFNLNAEYVVFKTLVSGSLLGYAVEDETGHRYNFSDRIFQAGETFKLHTGEGTDTQTDLYWGASGSAIWNNDGDTVKVLDPEDHIVTNYGY